MLATVHNTPLSQFRFQILESYDTGDKVSVVRQLGQVYVSTLFSPICLCDSRFRGVVFVGGNRVIVVVVLTEVRVYMLMWSIKRKNKFLQRKSVLLLLSALFFSITVMLDWMQVGQYSLGDIKCQIDSLSVD